MSKPNNQRKEEEMKIEDLLFKQVEKPKNHLMTKVVNLWDDRYRINVYTERLEDNLIKRKIHSSYFCQYHDNNLKILL